jgi:hypothetical protein
MSAPTSVGVSGDGDKDRGRALEDENRPQLNSAMTYNNLIIVTKEVGVNGRNCTANLQCKSLFLLQVLPTKSANDLNVTDQTLTLSAWGPRHLARSLFQASTQSPGHPY